MYGTLLNAEPHVIRDGKQNREMEGECLPTILNVRPRDGNDKALVFNTIKMPPVCCPCEACESLL